MKFDQKDPLFAFPNKSALECVYPLKGCKCTLIILGPFENMVVIEGPFWSSFFLFLLQWDKYLRISQHKFGPFAKDEPLCKVEMAVVLLRDKKIGNCERLNEFWKKLGKKDLPFGDIS